MPKTKTHSTLENAKEKKIGLRKLRYFDKYDS